MDKNYNIKEKGVLVNERNVSGTLDLEKGSSEFTHDVLITVPKEFTYMSEVFTDLPTNCILNKGITGCGGTTLAIQSERKYVIAVPNISMIENKLKSNKDMFGLYGGISINSLDEYVRRGGNKIMVTYDSLYKVSEYLGADTKDWHILIDEEHVILMAGDYRNKAVTSVLKQYKKYKAYTFLSATPVHNEFRLEEMNHIKKIEIHWKASFEGVVNKISSVDPLKDVAYRCVEALTSTTEKYPNQYIFLNSLSDIRTVIDNITVLVKKKRINLSENISVYCANNQRNKSFFKVKMKDKYKVSVVNERNRRINFLTATAFEGSDIFDDNGESVVVMTSKGHTALNIFTTLPQIFGRIRNTKHNKNVHVYYYNGGKDGADTEGIFENQQSFQKHLDKVIVESKDQINGFYLIQGENMIDRRNRYAKNIDYDNYFLEIGGEDGIVDELYINEALPKSKMNSYKTLMTTFLVMDRIHRANITRSVSYDYVPKKSKYTNKVIENIKARNGVNFKDMIKLYINLRKEKVSIESNNMDDLLPIPSSDKMSSNGVLNKYNEILEELKDLEGLYYDLAKWYESIGATGIIQADYSKKNIVAKYLSKNESMNNRDKVRALLMLKDGDIYPAKQLKHNLNRAYEKLGIDMEAKGEDIKEYYKAEYTQRRIRNRNVKGYSVIV